MITMFTAYILAELNRSIAYSVQQQQLAVAQPGYLQTLHSHTNSPKASPHVLLPSTLTVIGGVTADLMKKYYFPDSLVEAVGLYKEPGSELISCDVETALAEGTSDEDSSSSALLNRLCNVLKIPNSKIIASSTSTKGIRQHAKSTTALLSPDMLLIRQSELVILAEEYKFGRMCRDIGNSRLIPFLQALTEQTEMELSRCTECSTCPFLSLKCLMFIKG
jgi:hypothetical protein